VGAETRTRRGGPFDLLEKAATKSRLVRRGSREAIERHVLRVFHANYEALDERVNRLDHEAWSRPSKLYVGGDLLMEQPLGGFLWYLFFDAIHHRGQLSTYIRPMGGRVPSIHGPSGDDPGRENPLDGPGCIGRRGGTVQALRARTAGRSAGVGRRKALAGSVTTATVLPVMSKNSTE
jgi:hypothetical protein